MDGVPGTLEGGQVSDRDRLITEQIEYYRAAASEYDQWWLRLGYQDLESSLGTRWTAEVGQLVGIIRSLGSIGRVLEIAGGTGNFTRLLERHAEALTVIDSSPEALEISKRKLGKAGCDVEFLVCDVFDWHPLQRYDLVFFSFWLSHVPAGEFSSFWSTVREALAPGGRVVLIDNLKPLDKVAAAFRQETGSPTESDTLHKAELAFEGVTIRELSDGRRFRIVKRFWAKEQLARELRALGWDARIETTGQAFLWGIATPHR